MSPPMRYCIPLGKTVLIFFPSSLGGFSTRKGIELIKQQKDGLGQKVVGGGSSSSADEGYVVQVTIKQAYVDIIQELTTFFLAQFDITKAIESVLFAHTFTYLPPEIKIHGKGYVLRGKRRPWHLSKQLQLAWGDSPVRPSEDKWTFIFELEPTTTLESN
ncbi:hypothetical protein D9613_005744 [Agrocybe pediades]|uniref:Uncharacterized protein n=1 Tax=Agrocybe pediades TaxID=84607 RepID=A0A8H4QVZ9_9AGAR|nr:hypothetical protein D9613_005744 [Agrocybe pediades]